MTKPIFPHEMQTISGMDDLIELALDLRWSWDHGADDIWRPLSPDLWDLTRNPWVILQTIAPSRLQELASDEKFRAQVQSLTQKMRASQNDPTWFEEIGAQTRFTAVAYFSMEFMLGEALPIYSGGLGNVAGDQLKAASDLGVPVIGVGLLYQEGYFRQAITADGSQLALYPINDPGQLPITPARDAKGEWVRLRLHLPGYEVVVRAWQAQVGRVQLYLLDMNDPENPPIIRGLTNELYGGGLETRLAQEFVLGIGGWRLLRRLGLTPEVCHLNEGHAAFAILERAADFMQTHGQPFDVALQVTRAGNLFTTHTPVAAGFDHFPPQLLVQYLGRYARKHLGLTDRNLLALGRRNPDDETEPFNMAYLALRGSGAVNGVSRLHGEVSRGIFQPLFSRWPREEVPVGHVTNGIHVATWESEASNALWTRYCGKGRWLGETRQCDAYIKQVTNQELWAMRQSSRQALVEYSRKRYARHLAESGAPQEEITQAGGILDPDVLTLGFARRFAFYKRPTLLLRDPERLVRLLTHLQRPVQILVAGKAHPADRAGQEMIRQWVQFTRRPEVRGRAIFLSDYDMLLTQQMVNGVDVWINTPRRPWEACGTSGMKVLVNGGLNLSELDGWWAEAYTPRVGWALGDAQAHEYGTGWDAVQAEALFGILENDVIPMFYERTAEGLPLEWLNKIRESMTILTAQYSANRCVRQYTEEYYLAAAEACKARQADACVLGIRQAKWRQTLEEEWPRLSFGDLRVTSRNGQHHFQVDVRLGRIDPDAVLVQLCAETGGRIWREDMVRGGNLSEGGYMYEIQIPADRPAGDFTPRIIPSFTNVAIPLEIPLILWHH